MVRAFIARSSKSANRGVGPNIGSMSHHRSDSRSLRGSALLSVPSVRDVSIHTSGGNRRFNFSDDIPLLKRERPRHAFYL